MSKKASALTASTFYSGSDHAVLMLHGLSSSPLEMRLPREMRLPYQRRMQNPRTAEGARKTGGATAEARGHWRATMVPPSPTA